MTGSEKSFKEWAKSHGVDIYFYRNTIREQSGIYSVTVPEINLNWSGDVKDANEARILAVEDYEMKRKKNPGPRVTQKQLEKRVDYLNKLTDSPATSWTRKKGKTNQYEMTANVGNYYLDGAYGGVALYRMDNERGGAADISRMGHVPKKELSNFLEGFISCEEKRIYGNPKGRKKMAKKKRSAKQLANDKRLGRMAKARAKKKRGGRRKKVAKRKVTKRRVVRKRNVVRRGLPKRIAKKRTTRAKSHLWLIFRVYGNSVAFYNGGYPISNRWGTKGKAAFYQTKEQARKLASTLRVSPRVSVGICSADSTIHDIRKGLIAEKI